MDVASDLAPSGALRASINLGNPVLAHGGPGAPTGVSVDLARELGRRLGRSVELLCFTAARESYQAMADGRADLCFLTIDPDRADVVAFSPPYAVLEAVFATHAEAGPGTIDDVDRDGIRVGVSQGSAYDLFLTRTLTRAVVVRGAEGTAVFDGQGLEVAAGLRRPMETFVAGRPELRVLEPAFLQIRQAIGTSVGRTAATQAYLSEFVEELKASGFVADALARSGRDDAVVAPLAGSAS